MATSETSTIPAAPAPTPAAPAQAPVPAPAPAPAKTIDISGPAAQPPAALGGLSSINGFKTVSDLIRLLPTGTVFLFQFLNPALTNYGSSCSPANKAVSGVLIALCGLSCFLACFTDSYLGTDGAIHFGVVTVSGLLPFRDLNPPPAADLAKYRLQFADFVYAVFSVVVFAVISLLDPNSVGCFYPGFKSTAKAALMAVPPAVGAASTAISMVFPASRHWIGYRAINPTL